MWFLPSRPTAGARTRKRLPIPPRRSPRLSNVRLSCSDRPAPRPPLFLYDKDLRRHLRIVPLRMQIEELNQPDLFTFSLLPALESPYIDSARNEVRKLLEKSWPNLPIGHIARISTGAERYASKNEQAISGPASLLMHAALAGRQLRPDVIFVGELADDGALTRPRQSWDYLRALRVAKGGRLLVPPDFEPELRAMIALEDPGFFLRWEVLIVSSLEVALSLASVNGDPEGLALTSQLYTGLREVSHNKDVGQLCVNAKVRERLEEIVSKAPFHYSARMLLTQGNATKRPTRVEREVAARILRSAIEPLSGIVRPPLALLSVKRLIATGEASRAEIERFAKFISPREQDLLKEAREITQLAETLGRGKRERGPAGGRGLLSQNPPSGLPSKSADEVCSLPQETRPLYPRNYPGGPGASRSCQSPESPLITQITAWESLPGCRKAACSSPPTLFL